MKALPLGQWVGKPIGWQRGRTRAEWSAILRWTVSAGVVLHLTTNQGTSWARKGMTVCA